MKTTNNNTTKTKKDPFGGLNTTYSVLGAKLEDVTINQHLSEAVDHLRSLGRKLCENNDAKSEKFLELYKNFERKVYELKNEEN